jgi:metal-dependent HD superfamily phosphatase/phosphodiesterase
VKRIVTIDQILENPQVTTFIAKANEHLGAMGFTEHGFRHARLVSNIAGYILKELSYPPRQVELAEIAGYLHDIGNVVARSDHGQSGAMLASQLLFSMGMPADEIATIIGAIGNHEEEEGQPVSPVSAAVILADKSDVHRSRVRNRDVATFDIHDRVSYAAVESKIEVDAERKNIILNLTIETEICPVMDYFEIFLTRMIMCRRAAELLDCRFRLLINGAKLL